MKNIVIVGNGGLAKEVRWMIERINNIDKQWNILGNIDKSCADNVIGDDSFVRDSEEELSVVFALGDASLRKKLYNIYKQNPKVSFPNIIDPSVAISEHVKMGEANLICVNAVITVDVTIGNGVLANVASTIGHDCVVDDFATIGPHVMLGGGTHVKEGALLGSGVSIMQGSTIGKNVCVSMNSAVMGDIRDDVTVAGVPARIMIQR